MNLSKIISILVLVATVALAIQNRDLIKHVISPTEATTCTHEEHQHGESAAEESGHAHAENHSKGLRPERDQEIKPFYQGEVVTVEAGGSYTYLEVKEKTNLTFWVALERVNVKVGDVVRFQKEMVAKNFKSKALNRTFDEIMFASNLQQKVRKSDLEKSE